MAAPRKQPQDHLRKQQTSPGKAEARQQDIHLSYRGHDYVVEAARADDVELFELMEEEKYIRAVRGFLGDEQWQTLKDSIRTADGRAPASAVEEFLQQLFDAIGGPGNS